MIERGGFAWAATAAETDAERQNPWQLLEQKLPPVEDEQGIPYPRVPVVLDEATAMYSLHIGLGARYTIDDGHGHKLHMQVVGLLANSILQGTLVIDERWFLYHFPDVSGYRYFLIDCAPENSTAVEEVLEKNLGDYGFDAQSTGQRLAGLLAVQNTYLSTFQSLGGLGLLLGTFGLATVQLRNVLERRGELALLRAAGFRRRTLVELVLLESVALLVAGLGVGVLTALIAIAPQLVGGGASIPWSTLAGTLGLVLVAGLAASAAAARSVLATPLLPALRGE
jgi:ABC-type antimicrobial peptide transport system permease subunit